MTFEEILPREFFATPSAMEWFLTGVFRLVVRQIFFRDELFIATVTTEQLVVACHLYRTV